MSFSGSFPSSIEMHIYFLFWKTSAKNGCPVLYLRLGLIKPEGVKVSHWRRICFLVDDVQCNTYSSLFLLHQPEKCLIPLDKADRFFWNDMLFTWTEIIKEGRRNNPESLR